MEVNHIITWIRGNEKSSLRSSSIINLSSNDSLQKSPSLDSVNDSTTRKNTEELINQPRSTQEVPSLDSLLDAVERFPQLLPLVIRSLGNTEVTPQNALTMLTLTNMNMLVPPHPRYYLLELLNSPHPEVRKYARLALNPGPETIELHIARNERHARIFTKRDVSVNSKYVVNIAGVDLLHDSVGSLMEMPDTKPTSTQTELVITPTVDQTLREIALSIATLRPVLLQGPSGVGKTSLLKHVCSILSPHCILNFNLALLTINLGDTTDPSLLLGTYIQTAPGSFTWRHGVLATAVIEGRWVVLEDLDLAPVGVVAIVTRLIETRVLDVAARGDKIKAKDGFRVFASRRVETITKLDTATEVYSSNLGP
jgi:AAA domain (dynein-related subfamily)